MGDSPPASYQERIKNAHATGHLFVHMFETDIESYGITGDGSTTFDPDATPANLFKVMAQVPDASYKNGTYGSSYHTTPYGIVGLSTTAVHKDYPTALFDQMSSVGLLMDTATPIFVHAKDAMTRTKGDSIEFALTGRPFNFLMRLQGFSHYDWDFQDLNGSVVRSLSKEKMQDYIDRARNALSNLWENIQRSGWEAYRVEYFPGDPAPGMNEVNVAAKLGDVCGIVVYKRLAEDPNVYKKSLKAAQGVQEYLAETYPKTFPTKPPIMEYELKRDPQERETKPSFTELTPEIIEQRLAEASKGPRL